MFDRMICPRFLALFGVVLALGIYCPAASAGVVLGDTFDVAVTA